MRAFFISIIAGIVLSISIFETVYLGNFFKTLDNDVATLHNLVNAEENVPLQKKIITKIETNWDKSKCVLSLYLQHKEIDDLSEGISLVSALLTHYDKDELKIQIHQLIFLIESFHFIYDFNIVNIF